MIAMWLLCLSLLNVAMVWGQDADRALRHAVFFKYKDTASEQDRAQIRTAFESLPTKIDAIIDFEWGVRMSDEGISGGFTDCFLLTFEDEAGRDKYLPHPDHQAFAKMLGPFLEDVFVIDYWGRSGPASNNKLLRHAVFLKFKPDADPQAIDKVLHAFAALPQQIDTVQTLEWGTNNSPESHADGFTHAFLVTFSSEEGLAAYGPHPAHQELVALLRPVLQEVRVLDFWTE